MKFYKNLKLIVGISFMIMLLVNVVMYFYIENNVTILGYEINCLYIQILFILAEILFLSSIYGKKQGLTMCLIYFIIIISNLMFIVANLV